MSATNYFPAVRNMTSSYDDGMLKQPGQIFALSNYDKRKLALRKNLYMELFGEKWFYQRINGGNYPEISVDVSKENEDMKDEVTARSKRRRKKKKKKRTSARKTKATNGKKVAKIEKKKKKHWKELKAKTKEMKKKPEQIRYPRLMRARGKIHLAVAGSGRRRMYALGYAMSSHLVSLGRHRYKCLRATLAFLFNSVSHPWLDDDPSTKGHSSLFVLNFC